MNKTRRILLYFHSLNLLVLILIFIYLIKVSQSEHCCQSAPPVYYSEEENSKTLSKLDGIRVKNVAGQDVTICKQNDEGEACSSSSKAKRYILYDINPGEGFNLRRDIFVRIAPLIKLLNQKNPNLEYVLVLPPYRRIPHWRHTQPEKNFPWSTFFQLDKIRAYIPVVEFHAFLDEHGLDHGIDVLYKLKHFPSVDGGEWRENVEIDPECEKSQKIKPALWGYSLVPKKVECLSLRGQASTLLRLIQEICKNSKAIMFKNAEVILWDNYGDLEWWRARASLKFSQNLMHIAQNFMKENGLSEYISVHLRRRDFLLGRGDFLPSLEQVVQQILKLAEKLRISNLFLATDAEPDEFSQLKSKLSSKIQLITFPCTQDKHLTEGECAIIDQIISSLGTHFLGTKDSTFTFRIFEERLLLEKSVDSTYNYLCKSSSSSSCDKPTKWLVPDSFKAELTSS